AGRSIGSILSAAIDSDETVAVTAARDVPRGYAGGVMLFSPSGERFRIIETGRFMPRHVTFDQNHYLWVFGWQWDEDDWVLEDRNDYPIVRNFSRGGSEEGRLLLRKTFPGWTDGVYLFQAAKDRIGMLIA